MFRADLSKLKRFNDNTVLKAATKDELKAQIKSHLKGKNADRWNAMTDDEKTKLKSRFAEIIESN